MKKLVIVFALLFSTPILAQITLEHSYKNETTRIGLLQVDSNEYKYFISNKMDSISAYNLDHSLYNTFVIPGLDSAQGNYNLQHVSRRLFNTNDELEYLVRGQWLNNSPFLQIFDENSNKLFECLNCDLHNYANYIGGDATSTGLPSIINTSEGAKLLIYKYDSKITEIYSLPGKLPTSNTKLSVTDAPTIISGSSPPPSAYPNPSNGKIRVAYSLPEGVTTGELVITTTDGREVKRYRVGNMFNDILIEKSELASGAYFYKLITERGESEARKFVITQ